MHRISLEYLAIVLSTAGVYSTGVPVLLEIKLADITSLTLLVGVSVRAHATMYYTRVLLNCPALATVQDKKTSEMAREDKSSCRVINTKNCRPSRLQRWRLTRQHAP